jgi:monoamine oxidase
VDYDVVVIGAGAAGLICARTLGRAGVTTLVLEASPRAGGRMRDVADPRARGAIELGAEFVHGRPAITYDLLAEFGATVVDDAESSFTLRDGALEPAGRDAFAETAALLRGAFDRADESVEALLRRSDRGVPSETTAWARRLVGGFDAADPARASARAIAEEWAGDAAAGGAQSRPLGGYAPLVAHLVRTRDPARVHVRYETVATRVARDANGVTVDARARGADVRIRARRAIVTVPIGVLQAAPGAHGAIAFEPPLPSHVADAIAAIAMGPVVKVVLRFREPVWESLGDGAWRDGAFFSGDEAFPTVWTQLPVRADFLVAWAGGPAAERFAGASDAECIDAALGSIGRYFGDASAIESAFEVAYVHDWQRDPFARGAYSYVLVGGERARAVFARPVDDALAFAGEAAAESGEGGTVAGALQSGLRAAHDAVAAFAR